MSFLERRRRAASTRLAVAIALVGASVGGCELVLPLTVSATADAHLDAPADSVTPTADAGYDATTKDASPDADAAAEVRCTHDFCQSYGWDASTGSVDANAAGSSAPLFATVLDDDAACGAAAPETAWATAVVVPTTPPKPCGTLEMQFDINPVISPRCPKPPSQKPRAVRVSIGNDWKLDVGVDGYGYYLGLGSVTQGGGIDPGNGGAWTHVTLTGELTSAGGTASLTVADAAAPAFALQAPPTPGPISVSAGLVAMPAGTSSVQIQNLWIDFHPCDGG